MATAATADTLLLVPVATVSDKWLTAEFLPQGAAVLEEYRATGGVVWLPVDAGAEADYLLTKLAEFCIRRGWTTQESEVAPPDPYIFWAAVLGAVDEVSVLRAARDTVFLLRAGELLPSSSLRMHLPSLIEAGRTTRSTFLLPIFRSQVELLSDLPQCPCLHIPGLADATPERLQALAEALVGSRLPSLSLDNRRELANRLLAANPKSRSQMEAWLGTVSDAEDPLAQVRSAAFPQDQPAHEPLTVPTREELQNQFDRARTQLDAAAARFQELGGPPLLFPHQPLRAPFASGGPADWFFALVSHLSCLIFDAGETTLDCLARFRFDPDRGDIVGDPVSSFLTDLRLLRTSFQHALSLHNQDDQRKSREVAAWYRRQCGQSSPGPEHYRGLVVILVQEWRAVVDGVLLILDNLSRAPSSLAVQNALAAARRHLPLGELLRLIRESVERIDPSVEGERVKRKHEQRIQRLLKDCCYTGMAFFNYARDLVEGAVSEESLTSPIDGSWLQQRGIQGLDVARWKQYFQKLWDQAPPAFSRKEFMDHAIREISKAREESRTGPPEAT